MPTTPNASTIAYTCSAVLCTLLAVLPQDSRAACQWVQGSSNSTLNAPATLTAPSEAPLLSPLSDWLEGNYYPLWKCSSLLNLDNVRSFYSTASSASGYQYEGLTVYQTSTPGVGYVAKGRALTSAGNTGWKGIANSEWGLSTPSPATLGVGLMLRLIKIGPILPGTQLKKTEVAYGGSKVGSYPDLFTHISIGPIDFIVPTCQTRDVDVMLGEVYMGKFSGVGSEAGARDFAITLDNCPAGFNKITYRLDPVNEVLDASKGLIQIDKGSGNASGIAIRVQGRGSTLRFGTEQELSGYNGSKGSYDIPLSASYYQTGPITPGTANASLEFRISYQ